MSNQNDANFMAGIEVGIRCAEKGMNLQAALLFGRKTVGEYPTVPDFKPIDTYAIQINGRTELVLQGQLRFADSAIGPGGVFTVLNARLSQLAQKGDRVFIIALPDAPANNAPNKARRQQEKLERS